MEKEVTPKNRVDDDFDAIEESESLQERGEMARDVFDQILDPPAGLEYMWEATTQTTAKGKGNIKHFFLPDIPGGDGDMDTIREGYDERAEYFKTPERMFLRVGQGEMWVLPKSENPYAQIAITECSALVGSNENNLVVAHISFSAQNETEAVMKFFEANNIDPENVHAIASVGDYQKERSDGKRVVSKQDYIDLGVPTDNVHEFEHIPIQNDESEDLVNSNTTKVLISKEMLFKYSYDLKAGSGFGFNRSKDEIIGDYKDEEVIEI